MAPTLLCYDCDAFFVQCAYLAWPEKLRGVRHLLVGGHPEKRGVVASCSYAAREHGVRSGIPMASALRLCPEALAVPVPWTVVRAKSREVRAVARRFAEAFESASVDEGYLLLPPSAESAEEAARRLQRAVLEEAGVTISIGAAARKFIAKMATSHAKPAGVHAVPPGAEADFVAAHALGDIPGIGPAFVEALRVRGVRSVVAAREVELRTLVRWLGPARAHFLHQRVRGLDSRRVGEDSGERKSVSSETTFERDVTDLATLERTLRELSEEVAQSLRRLGLRARTVSVKLREEDFTDHQRSCTLREAVDSERHLFHAARKLVDELRRAHPAPVRLLGVGASRLLGPGSAEQLPLPDILPPLEAEIERRFARTEE